MPNDTCYILALIKRDDGERLLLGSGFYQFTKDQKHFNPNVYANDIVELQGADGQLLAGQVRRSSAQSFDGYIGDGTTSKDAVEQKRREFFLFFRKQHHYTVVYIMPDGTAIKRDRGYIVDAPAVQELYQVQPKWHIALAFEDVNYYSYAEDALGNEIYSFSQMLGLANIVDGGLIWDANGAISTPAGLGNIRINGDTFQKTTTGKNIIDQMSPYVQGYIHSDGTIVNSSSSVTATEYFPAEAETTYTISWTVVQSGTTVRKIAFYNSSKTIIGRSGDCTNGGTITTPQNTAFVRFYLNRSDGMNAADAPLTYIKDIQMEKGSTPTSYEEYTGAAPSPSPDFPQAIQTVTGSQTVTIAGTSYTVDLGSIELCKLGTYQDYIWKDGGDWKIHKATGKTTADVTVNALNGTTSGTTQTSSHGAFFIFNSTLSGAKTAIISTNLGVYKLDANVVGNAGANAMEDGTMCNRQGTNDRLYFRNTALIGKTGNAVKSLLTSTGTGANVYYSLDTPTDTTITDAGLIAQLEAVAEAMAEDGKPSIVTPAGTNLPAIIMGDLNGTGGYEWAPSTGGGPVTVTVDGVDSANPVWHVFGACSNPTLTNSTTGQALTWNGDVPAGQELIIDMGAQTATLEGANVFEFVSGSWIQLAPGTNRVSYTAANTTQDSKLEWNEIVG